MKATFLLLAAGVGLGLLLRAVLLSTIPLDPPDCPDEVEEWPLQWRGKWTVDRHVIDGTDEP